MDGVRRHRIRGVPPGRAGQLWLRHRLATARRGADLLDRKLRLLQTLARELDARERGAREAWARAASEAEVSATRAVVLGGERALRLAQGTSGDPSLGEVALTWASVVGTRYPEAAEYTPPGRDPSAAWPTNAAVVVTADRHARALEAAVVHAAAQAALQGVQRELRATRLRLRSIRDRWLPRLDSALATLEFALEEEERDEAVRLRWCATRTGRSAIAREQRSSGG